MPKVAITSRELAPTELPLFTELPLRGLLDTRVATSTFSRKLRASGDTVFRKLRGVE